MRRRQEFRGLPRYTNQQVRKRPGQVVAEGALVQATILAAKLPQEVVHSIILVLLALKEGREASTGEARSNLGIRDNSTARCAARRTSHTSDKGTCENVAMW